MNKENKTVSQWELTSLGSALVTHPLTADSSITTVTDVKLLQGVLVTRQRVIVISVVSITLLGIVVMSSLSVEAGDDVNLSYIKPTFSFMCKG